MKTISPIFLHLIDLFNDYLCFYTYLKQLNFFADIPGRGHSGPLHTTLSFCIKFKNAKKLICIFMNINEFLHFS